MTLPGDESTPRPTEEQDNFLKSLNLFTQQHRAGHWSGSFAQFMETVLPLRPHQVARS